MRCLFHRTITRRVIVHGRALSRYIISLVNLMIKTKTDLKLHLLSIERLNSTLIHFPVWTLLSLLFLFVIKFHFAWNWVILKTGKDFGDRERFWGQERILETGNRDLQISWKLSSVQYVSPYLLKKIVEIWKRTASTWIWTGDL